MRRVRPRPRKLERRRGRPARRARDFAARGVERDLVRRQPGVERPGDQRVHPGAIDVEPGAGEAIVGDVELAAIVERAVGETETARGAHRSELGAAPGIERHEIRVEVGVAHDRVPVRG